MQCILILFTLYHSFSLPCFPKSPKTAPLLLTWSYIHGCMYIWSCIHLSFRTKFQWPLSFWPGLLHLNDDFQFHCFTWKWHNLIFLYGWIIFHCLYILNPFVNCRASGLFPWFGYCEECCSKHGCASVSVISWLTFLHMYAQEWYCWIIMVVLLLVFWDTSMLLSIVVALIHTHISSVKGWFFPCTLANICCCVLDDSHSNKSEVESQYHFDLHFLYGQRC
jgi:hypothetical protein